ncbi:hypothetical protein, partial [Mesotoga sp.]
LDEEQDLLFLTYLRGLNEIRLTVDGTVLIEKYRMKEGPEIRELLEELLCARLDGLAEEKEDEFVREYLKGRD